MISSPPSVKAAHWAEPYLGLKWESTARGPERFDCWGLLWWVKAHHFGQEIPEQAGLSSHDLHNVCRVGREYEKTWTPLSIPHEGCAVAMSKRGDGVFHHVGIYTEADGGLVLHAVEGANVVLESLSRLKNRGFGRIKFYEYGCNH